MDQNEQKLTQLTQAVEELKKRSGITELAAAYTAAYSEIDNVIKNKDNPHFGSTYADLSAVLDTIRPIFAKHGLALLQSPGEMDGDKVTLTWMLLHKSGQVIQGRMSLPIGSKATAQAAGSAITYSRRYQAAAVAGISQVDDDGNAASAAPDKAPRGGKNPAGHPRESSSEGGSYAETRDALIAKVKGSPDLPSLEALKPELAEFGDQEVANAYAAKKRELKGKK